MPVVIQTKAIKPKKLRIEDIRIELEKAVTFEGEAIRKDYEKTTRTWKRKPEFEVVPEVSKTEITVLVGTDSEIYKFVDEGTRSHRIYPRRKPRLWFRKTFRAKTSPGVIGSRSGGSSGQWITPKKGYVDHPGTQARNFTKIIQRRHKKSFRDAMLKAVQKGAKIANDRGQA